VPRIISVIQGISPVRFGSASDDISKEGHSVT
jgi:hypothetical protein